MSFAKQPLKALAALAVFTTVALLSTAGPAEAQELKIGVVNVNVLMEQAPQAKVAMEALQEEFAPRQRDIVAKQKEFEDMTAKVQRDVAVMGETERRNAERELRDLQRDVQRMQEEFREDLNLRRNEELGNLQRSLLKEVQDYAEASGFDLIIGDGVLYASSAINVTQQVLEAMQKNFEESGSATDSGESGDR
ncbi:MAG TPA: OmpH family outer membrane protein [Woeseiaceae bacterium]|nr:OmpH family outer membrane protein [Woeseiaceae bacterium]